MAFLYEKYKPEIDKVIEDIKKVIKLYDEVLTKNPKDSYAEKKQNELYIYLNKKKKDLKDMPNRADEFEYYISEMKKYLANARSEYNKSYAGRVRADATKEDAKKAFIAASAEFRALIKKLRDFNNQYKQNERGNHTDNYAAMKLMKEIEEKIGKYDSELSKEEQTTKPNYDKYIQGLNSAIEYYKKNVESTIRDQSSNFSKDKDYFESQPGE